MKGGGEDSTKIARCAACSNELKYADYCTGVQEGVIGGTGFVATHLHDWLLFCCRECLIDYWSDEPTDYGSLKPRIP